MHPMNRRNLLQTASAATAFWAATPSERSSNQTVADQPQSDSKPLQLYKSLSDDQRQKICLPRNHKSRQFISNWWYIHPEHRIPSTFNSESKRTDSVHFRLPATAPNIGRTSTNKSKSTSTVKWQTRRRSVFSGHPRTTIFEFIYTGHHVDAAAAMRTVIKGTVLEEHRFFTVTFQKISTKPRTIPETPTGTRARSSTNSFRPSMASSSGAP